MGLEAATFIHELDPSNPVGGSDPKSQGDDHIRLTKSTLQNTLPNVEGAVTASHTELNILDGATLTTAELNKLDGYTGDAADLNNILSRFGGLKVAFCRVEANSAANPAYANKNITSVTRNSAGSFTIDYTAAGFTTPPVVLAALQNQALFFLSVSTTTTTQTAISIHNHSLVFSDGVFFFFAIGT